MQLKQRAGFGIIEVMVGAALLMTAIMGALFVTGINSTTASDNPISIGLAIAKTALVNNIQNDQSWSRTVQDLGNTSMDCLRNQTDCFSGTPATGFFALRDAANTLTYNGQSPTEGFTIQGTPCSTYDPVNGNALCPIRFNVQWVALCTGLPCINPPLRVIGTAEVKFTAKRSTVVNLSRFNFDVYRKRVYCPATPAAWDLVPAQPPVTCTPANATSGTNGLVFPAGTCISSGSIDACKTTRLAFTYAPAFSGGALLGDAANQARVCWYASGADPVTAPCIYEWHQSKGIWSLAANGVTVYTAPAVESVSSFLDFEFTLNNGSMRFYLNGTRRYFFDLSYRLPMQVSFRPGSTSYSPLGFRTIRFNSQ